jgi:hypothetical protein
MASYTCWYILPSFPFPPLLSFPFRFLCFDLLFFLEADPRNYHKLKQNRVDSINIHAALCKEPRILHYTETDNPAINGIIEFMAPSFIQLWHPQLHASPELIEKLPSVLCLPFRTLVHELNIHHLDIWILDVEGAELMVLQGTDFSKISISTIVMECDRSDAEKDAAKEAILRKNKFSCVHVWEYSLYLSHLLLGNVGGEELFLPTRIIQTICCSKRSDAIQEIKA